MKVRIALSGLNVTEVERVLKEIAGDKVETIVASDMQGAAAVKSGQADYFIGVCNTGGGGALGVAIAVLGYSKCGIVSVPGLAPKAEKIRKFVEEGKVAFGITNEHIKLAIPPIIEAILAKREKG